MEYLVTFLTIIVTSIIVYILTNKVLGIRLHIKPLVLCALCAILVSLILPHIVLNFAGFTGTIGLLGIFAVIFAYFISCYDDQAMASQISPENNEISSPAFFPPVSEISDNPNQIVEFLLSSSVSVPDTKESDAFLTDLQSTPVQEFVSESQDLFLVEPKVEEMNANSFEPVSETESFYLPAATITPNSHFSEPEINNNSITTQKLELPDESSEESVETEIIQFSDEVLEPEQLNILDEPASDSLSNTPSESRDCFVADNLEDLLDEAFAQKASNNTTLALDYFRRAFNLYTDSDAAPLIAVEIANLLKNKGAYDEAIAHLTECRSLATLKENEVLDQEYTNTIAYLRIIKNTLASHRLGFLPFSSIPADVAKEIEDEFCEWRNMG